MRVEYINPFVETSYRVLKEVLGGAEVKRGDLYLKSTAMPVMGVAALVGLAGDVEGRVLFDMTFEPALNIASQMNMAKIEKFDDLECRERDKKNSPRECRPSAVAHSDDNDENSRRDKGSYFHCKLTQKILQTH